MSTHTHGLRSRLNSPGVSIKTTPSNSPFAKTGARSPRKAQNGASLSLRHVIGTTTSNPSGFSCHAPSNAFAYCAGCAVVLAKVESNGHVSQRFYKARPTASSINPCIPFYDTGTPTGSPSSKRRSSILPSRFGGHGAKPLGSPLRGRGDDGEVQTWTARERIKAATSVSLSPNGRFLAVGETGYNPRVLLFSTAEDAPFDLPLSIMSEHSFGVRAVAFSLDSRYLATLGDVNDGFLFIWSVNSKTGGVQLHSTNKCTTNVCEMIWCGKSLVTVGTRHVKVWRIGNSAKPSPSKRVRLRSEDDMYASPGPTPLLGRNCLLGSLADCTFTCAAAISDHEAVICTDDGQICLLDDTDGAQELKFVKRTGSAVSSISANVGMGEVFLGCERGRMHSERMDDLRQLAHKRRRASSTPQPPPASDQSPKLRLSINPETRFNGHRRKLIGIGCLAEGVVSVDSECNMLYETFELAGSGKQQNQFAAHDDSVQGLQILPNENKLGAFFTWSCSGIVKFWDTEGLLKRSESLDLGQTAIEEEDCSNELIVVHYIPSINLFVSGDRFGVLKLVSNEDWRVLQEIRGHSAQITNIISQNVRDDSIMATCGRDRVAQLFSVGVKSFELLQTMDEHIGAVNQALFTNAGERLLTSSADRTIIIRDRISRNDGGRTVSAYLTSRVITIKAAPLSMACLPDQTDVLAISTMDRHIVKLSISSGSVMETFKVADPENDDTTVLNSVCLSRTSEDSVRRLLVGFSSTDKSIRVYDFDRNTLLTRESGHIEGISDIALLEQPSEDGSAPKRTVISTGLDGTIMIWSLTIAPPQPLVTPLQELSHGQAMGYTDSSNTPSKPNTTSLPPMRKVLSKLDIADFVRVDPTSGSPIPIRDPSPARLRRKTSRLAMANSKIPEHEVPVLSPMRQSAEASNFDDRGRFRRLDSPSPPPPGPSTRLKKQRSRTEISRDLAKNTIARSPSPPSQSHPTSVPNTPRHFNRANNGRLRRPPSVPMDLRAQATAQGRRKSMGNANDFGSIGMAGDQACRMLRAYRKKLLVAKEDLDLDEVEEELIATLKVVKEKRETATGKRKNGWCHGTMVVAPPETEMDNLAVLLQRTVMAEEKMGEAQSKSQGVEVDTNGH